MRIKCKAVGKQNGKQCGNWAMKGQLCCRMHGGASPQAKAAATRRLAVQAMNYEVEQWGLGDTSTDPGTALLQLLTQARIRAQMYAGTIAELVEQHGLQEALIGDSLMVNPAFIGGGRNAGNGQPKFVKIGEYLRGLTVLENSERDRAAKYAKLAIDADLVQAQSKLTVQQGALIEAVLLSAFERLHLTADQRKAAPEAIRLALAANS
jgi:hypothetical protein